MNCFTLEASFHGYFDEEHTTMEFKQKNYEEMGEHLVNSLYEYFLILEEEDRIKLQKKNERMLKKKKIQDAK